MMVKKNFYEVLQSGKYDSKAIQKLPFRIDETGPLFEVTLSKKYNPVIDAIKSDDFTLKVNGIEIKDSEKKISLLGKLVYNHKTI
jgi:hypothetical protein